MSAEETPWKVPGKWSLSPYGFEPEVRKDWKVPKKVTIHDVTLRDGEQTPGVVFRKEEKLKIAHALEDMGVQRIEGGMVAVSDEDFDALATMARELKQAEVYGFCRARRDDMERAVKAKLGGAVMEITALDPIIKNIWGSRGKAVEDIVGLAKFGKANGLKVCFFLMESARAPLDLIRELIVPVVEEGGADTVAIVDTRGSSYPAGFAWQIAQVKKMVKVPVEIHCHNNWGLSTANTLAAITAGAEIAHTCINGMGGNPSLDEIVMGIEAFLQGADGGEDRRVPRALRHDAGVRPGRMVQALRGPPDLPGRGRDRHPADVGPPHRTRVRPGRTVELRDRRRQGDRCGAGKEERPLLDHAQVLGARTAPAVGGPGGRDAQPDQKDQRRQQALGIGRGVPEDLRGGHGDRRLSAPRSE